jgi:hypothetical protein
MVYAWTVEADLPLDAMLEYEDEGYILEALRRRSEKLDRGSVRKLEDLILLIVKLLGG